MKLKEFLESTGMKMMFLCEKTGISRQTIYRINIGEAVSEEVSNTLRTFCKRFGGYDVDINTCNSHKSHVRNRSKKHLQSNTF